MKNNKVYIIIIHYKGLEDTFSLLDNLLSLDYQDFQVILVNNNPEENLFGNLKSFIITRGWNLLTEQVEDNYITLSIDKFKYPVVLINQERNLGYAGGVNTGIRYTLKYNDFSYLWILNNDLILAPDSLRELINFAEKLKSEGKRVGIIGSKLLYYHSPQILQGIGGKYNKYFALTKHVGGFEEDKGQYDRENIEIDYVIGASMFVPKEFIEDVGLMDERYFLYFEDVDWCERARRKGYVITCCYKSKVYHKEGASIGSSSKGEKKSELADYYGIRNRIVFTKKFYPQYLFTVYLSLLGVILNRVKRRQFNRIKLVFEAIKDIPKEN
ncbi:glycosyltransferase family 2 protein [Dictyoglomus thermophilum]|uniref:Rhamnosyl transferase n=1 Tax=Dictyoglomus thermophilum (strain ATCC 35947 / DSM 3960 / H-6-12) TaxID=309799 RepID=B5YBH1_DICT6|nr:glycosyltransferase family 2 protein [Dictyoglomus thermophilum]ACI19928.1 rhamnosyl transferase [Dictyoglomus thermophilum H-6-12]